MQAFIRELRDYAIEEAREDAILHLRATLAYLTRIVTTSAATLEDGDELIHRRHLLPTEIARRATRRAYFLLV